jgi:hypothetical protein
MKKSNRSSRAKSHKQKSIGKGGKRSLYSPKLGSSNWRKARDGRYALHPAFRAYRKLQGAKTALQLAVLDLKQITQTKKVKQMNVRLSSTELQLGEALKMFAGEAKELKSSSDKLHFAEAIAAASHRTKKPDDNVERVCWRAVEMRTRGENPSQVELRRAVQKFDGITFSDLEWKRLLKRTGLNRLLPHREKLRGSVCVGIRYLSPMHDCAQSSAHEIESNYKT